MQTNRMETTLKLNIKRSGGQKKIKKTIIMEGFHFKSEWHFLFFFFFFFSNGFNGRNSQISNDEWYNVYAIYWQCQWVKVQISHHSQKENCDALCEKFTSKVVHAACEWVKGDTSAQKGSHFNTWLMQFHAAAATRAKAKSRKS